LDERRVDTTGAQSKRRNENFAAVARTAECAFVNGERGRTLL